MTIFSSDQKHSCNKLEFNRREALVSAIVASSTILSFPRVSNAVKNDVLTSSFDNLELGTVEWINLHDVSIPQEILLQSSKIVPPNFATYLTRFLIRYDVGLSKWWDDLEMTYSLLSSASKRSKLGHNFGEISKSLQISIGTFIFPKDQSEPLKDVQVKEKYQILLQLLVDKYAKKSTNHTPRIIRDIALLFSILPGYYQPSSGIQSILVYASMPLNDKVVGNQLSVAFTEELTELLPDSYSCVLNKTTNTYEIAPLVALYEIGVDDEYGQSATATLFGPLSSSPLRRQNPNLSFRTYALFGLSGALGCAITHSVVIPFDVVKTRLQTNPEQYSDIMDGAVTIAKEEGVEGFLLGSQATIIGYLWYGLSVYPLYAYFKLWLGQGFFSPAIATANADVIAFLAGMIAAVIASIGLTPIEACRIRTVSDPQTYRPLGLVGTAQSIASEDSSLGWRSLFNGLSSLMIRQVIFGGIKFLAFERACDAFFLAWPALRDSNITSLLVTVVGGAIAGAISSVLSQPADSILTYIAKNKTENGGYGLMEGCQDMIENDGFKSLFNGLGSRCLWASAIISGQFLLYDIFRDAFGINYEDLSQVLKLNISII